MDVQTIERIFKQAGVDPEELFDDDWRVLATAFKTAKGDGHNSGRHVRLAYTGTNGLFILGTDDAVA